MRLTPYINFKYNTLPNTTSIICTECKMLFKTDVTREEVLADEALFNIIVTCKDHEVV